MKKNNLTKNDILNKKFTTELSGYNPTEVDQFLDKILEDYYVMNDEIKILEDKVKEKNMILETRDDTIEKLEHNIENLKMQLKESSKSSNYELLKEIQGIKKQLKVD